LVRTTVHLNAGSAFLMVLLKGILQPVLASGWPTGNFLAVYLSGDVDQCLPPKLIGGMVFSENVFPASGKDDSLIPGADAFYVSLLFDVILSF